VKFLIAGEDEGFAAHAMGALARRGHEVERCLHSTSLRARRNQDAVLVELGESVRAGNDAAIGVAIAYAPNATLEHARPAASSAGPEYVPIDDDAALGRALERLAAAVVGTRTARILVVEDDDDTRECLAEVIEAEGYAVLRASSGIEALQLIARPPLPDLVMLDLMMPGMDGWALLRELRAREALPGVPIVVASSAPASLIPSDLPRIAKPLRWQPVVDMLRRYLGPRPRVSTQT
jgi:CheY-like chemotaxis protein